MLLSNAVQIFFIDREHELSQRTQELYGYIYSKLIAHIGDKPVAEVSKTDIQSYLNTQTGLSKRSLNVHYQAIRSLYAYLTFEQIVTDNIAAQVRQPKFNKLHPVCLTDDEVRIVLVYTKQNKRLDAIVKLAIDSGARIGEVIAIKTNDFDTKTGKLVLIGKGSKRRTVFVSKQAIKVVLIYRATVNGEYLFVTNTGKPLIRTQIQRDMVVMSNKIGVKVHFHLFRHYYAQTAIKQGMSLLQLSHVLGHKSPEVTLEYLKTLQADTSDMVNYSPLDNL